jgi:hypothetical protein
METNYESVDFNYLSINQENGLIELRSQKVIIETFDCIELIDLVHINVYEVWGGFENSKRLEVRSATSVFPEECMKVDGHWKCKNGTLIVPTSHHLCVLIREKVISEFCIISMSGLEQKASRRWNNKAMGVVKKNNNYRYCPPKYTMIYSASVIKEKGRHMWDFSSPTEIDSIDNLNYLIAIKDNIAIHWRSIVYKSQDN